MIAPTASPLLRYQALIRALWVARASAGGDLPDDIEDDFQDALDAYWLDMTDEEHERLEAWLIKEAPR